MSEQKPQAQVYGACSTCGHNLVTCGCRDSQPEPQAEPSVDMLEKARTLVRFWKAACRRHGIGRPHRDDDLAEAALAQRIAEALQAEAKAQVAEITRQRDDALNCGADDSEPCRLESECNACLQDMVLHYVIEGQQFRAESSALAQKAREAERLIEALVECCVQQPHADRWRDGMCLCRWCKARRLLAALRAMPSAPPATPETTSEAKAIQPEPREKPPEARRCVRCGGHHQGGLNYGHAFIPTKPRKLTEAPREEPPTPSPASRPEGEQSWVQDGKLTTAGAVEGAESAPTVSAGEHAIGAETVPRTASASAVRSSGSETRSPASPSGEEIVPSEVETIRNKARKVIRDNRQGAAIRLLCEVIVRLCNALDSLRQRADR